MFNRTKIGLTIGSTNSEWLELALRGLSDRNLLRRFQPLLIGPQEIIFAINNDLRLGLDFTVFHSLSFVWPKHPKIIIIDRSKGFPLQIKANKPSKAFGQIAISSLDAGIKLAFEFKINALVIGPICFHSIAAAGFHYDSVVQILSEWTRIENVVEEKQGQVSWFKNMPVVVTSLQRLDGAKAQNYNPFKAALDLADARLKEKRRN